MTTDGQVRDQAVMVAARLVDQTYREYSTYAMPKELRRTLNVWHQQMKTLTESEAPQRHLW